MKKQNQMVVTGLELVKTVAGVGIGRFVAIKGAEMLKVAEEADPKKAKIKKIAIGGGVLAVGAIGAIKAPNDYKSVFAGIATAGALSAMSPFAKDDAGFIPALHGGMGTATIEDEEDEQILLELNGSYNELLDEEQEEEDSYFNRDLRSPETEEVEYEDMTEELN